jgi:hypothetical protein
MSKIEQIILSPILKKNSLQCSYHKVAVQEAHRKARQEGKAGKEMYDAHDCVQLALIFNLSSQDPQEGLMLDNRPHLLARGIFVKASLPAKRSHKRWIVWSPPTLAMVSSFSHQLQRNVSAIRLNQGVILWPLAFASARKVLSCDWLT